MKKFLLLVVLCCLFALPVQASVRSENISGANYKGQYPVVEAVNNKATAAINRDLKTYVDKFVDALQNGTLLTKNKPDRLQYVEGALSWELYYEDEKVLSLVLTDYYYAGGAHGMHYDHGLVYDKITGQRKPLTDYVRITPFQLASEAHDNLYSLEKDGIKIETIWIGSVTRVPEDYFLLEDGTICPLFTLYELVPYASGSPCVHISPAKARFYNKLNG